MNMFTRFKSFITNRIDACVKQLIASEIQSRINRIDIEEVMRREVSKGLDSVAIDDAVTRATEDINWSRHIDYRELADNLCFEYRELARYLEVDYRELVECLELDKEDIASNIDLDYAELAESIHIDYDNLAERVGIDTDDIANRIMESLKVSVSRR